MALTVNTAKLETKQGAPHVSMGGSFIISYIFLIVTGVWNFLGAFSCWFSLKTFIRQFTHDGTDLTYCSKANENLTTGVSNSDIVSNYVSTVRDRQNSRLAVCKKQNLESALEHITETDEEIDTRICALSFKGTTLDQLNTAS